MATTGKFEVFTDAWNALKPDEIVLHSSSDLYELKVQENIGNAGKSWSKLELSLPKIQKLTVFDVKDLPSVAFVTFSDSHTARFAPVSGKLTAWIAAGSAALNGVLQMEMKPTADSEIKWPEQLSVTALFSLSHEHV
ncbi:hypothetical protein N8H74_26475 [Pseudomonas sp. B2M1-30]|uniref:hypothetical protein n=1 Tax=Pseudomonas TaxID=286 RepID=UPI0021C8BEFB|nr:MULTISPECIES: hypothetical protein [Pseudomonas]MCU0121818.1 hypothetical protein [Pseudomonas sp. B2M1-30]MCU7264490.1 hypothetical protein [Pseudomonas koreensis]